MASLHSPFCFKFISLFGSSSDLFYSSSSDTIQDGSVAISTPHTGFSDPTAPDGAPLRQSIELRALVFYDWVFRL